MIRDLAAFRSARLAPLLPESSQVNPGRYGAELAFWLGTRLYQEHGIATSYPKSEDWGWWLRYSAEEGSDFAIHCGNLDGEDEFWLISLRRLGRGWFRRGSSGFEGAGELVAALGALLEAEEDIAGLDWLWIDGLV